MASIIFRQINKNKPWSLQDNIKNEPNRNGDERWTLSLLEVREATSRKTPI